MSGERARLEGWVQAARQVGAPTREDRDRNWKGLSGRVASAAVASAVVATTGVSSASATAVGTAAIKAGVTTSWAWKLSMLIGVGCLAGATLGVRALILSRPAGDAAGYHPVEGKAPPISVVDPATAVASSGGPAAQQTAGSPAHTIQVPLTKPVPKLSSDRLSEEVALLRSAKRAIDRAEGLAALAILDVYRREHPHGVLGNEARATRVMALCLLHRDPEARKEASHLDPGSPLAGTASAGCAKN